MNIFISPFVNALFGIYYLIGNLGWAVVIITILIRLLLLPLVLPSLKSAKKMRDLQPRLKKLQEKYKNDKQKLAQAQMELYRQEGINPLSGCLPQLLQIAVLLLFFSAFNVVTGLAEGRVGVEDVNRHLISNFQITEGFAFNKTFFGADITQTPSRIFNGGLDLNIILPLILLLGSGVMQYLVSKLMTPNPKASEQLVDKTEDKEDDMMAAMRTQTTYFMPIMTVIIGWNFSLGVLIYWFMNSLVMLVQQVVTDKFAKV
ncbi:MAG: YidC/Oxa1 family membrane protein insertase [Patescibacteria group bacterium]|jgi:YidC/Oxa1 family membrane protein insertase